MEPNTNIVDALLKNIAKDPTGFSAGQTIYYGAADIAFLEKMLSGGKPQPTDPSYSIPGAAPDAYTKALKTWEEKVGTAFATISNFSQITDAFAAIAQFVGVEFKFTTDESKMNIRFATADLSGMMNSETATVGNVGGFNQRDFTPDVSKNYNIIILPQGSSWDFKTILHEIGHALGLAHPGTYKAGAEQPAGNEDNKIDTMMSYISTRPYDDLSPIAEYGSLLQEGFAGSFTLTPMRYDILALQELLGKNTETKGDNTIFKDFRDVSSSDWQFQTLFDADGKHDLLDISKTTKNAKISLEPGTASAIGGDVKNVVIDFYTVIEDVIGGAGNDLIIGNKADNILLGGEGDDTLIGGECDDVLDGGENGDVLYGDDKDNLDAEKGGNDRLVGGKGKDSLYGGGGNDVLNGVDGEGGDYLAGGRGFDTYYADKGDIINDSDGQGEIFLNGKKLTFATRKKGEKGAYSDGTNFYLLQGETLTITDSRGRSLDALTIEGFTNKSLGVYLDEEEEDDDLKPPPYNPDQAVRPYYDPLALDLNGNGTIDDTTLTGSRTYFDLTGDGIAEKTAWIGGGDGLLAFDANGNGVIDNVSELFADDQTWANGFGKLGALFDSNNDGQITAEDTRFSELRIWQDANGDGISQAGELKSLTDWGITALNTKATPSNTSTANGNQLIATGSFTRDGQDYSANALLFAYNPALTDANPQRPLGQAPELRPEIFTLPWLRGFGLVKSLHIAYQEQPELQQLAEKMVSEGHQSIVDNFDSFMARWSGLTAAQQAKGISRTTLTTADKIWMLETFNGVNVHKSAIENGNFSPGNWDENYINTQWQDFASREMSAFFIQTLIGSQIKGVDYSLNKDRFIVTDATLVESSLATWLSSVKDAAGVFEVATIFTRFKKDGIVFDSDGFAEFLANSPYKYFFTHLLKTGNLPNFVNGTAGNDSISAFSGASTSNIISGGKGNDFIESEMSADTYLFNRGDGEDTIFDNGYADSTAVSDDDQIVFGAGIQASNLAYSRNDDDLIVKIDDPNNPQATDQITIQYWFYDSRYQIEQFVFADGTTLTAEQISGLGNFIYGTAGDDSLYFGGTGSTTIFAGDGNDLVYAGENSAVDGGDGNDTIIGSAGTNRLIGGAGNDTITYQSRSSNTIEGGDGDDRITIQGYYHYGDANYRNIITGGKGNDTIQSGGSADTYLFNRGDGSDTLFDSGYSYYSTEGVGEDRIIFGAGIQASDLTYSRQNNNDLLITINDPNNPSATDQITIQNWFADSTYQIEQFVFADGATLNAEQVSGLGNFVYGTEGDDNIDFRGTGDTTIFAGDGNDLVYAGENSAVDGGDGNDTIIGSAGTNRLIGGAGNDTITYQSRSSNTIEGGDGDDRITIQGYYHYGDANYQNIITGGKGNDTIQSGGSADTYLFNRGDGSDTLFDNGYSYYSTEGVGEDRIIFGAGIQASDLTYSRQNNNDLLITINDPNNPSATDQITIQNWFADSTYQIEQFVFADGATLNAEQVSGLGNFVYGTEGDDNIDFRGTGDTTIFAGDGNDLVYAGENSAVDGGDGNDTIIGSTGTNRLIGGAGNDTITYQSRSSNTIEGGDGDDRITIQGYYHYGDANYRNIITGGKGNDTIQSGGSADTYLFNRGDGSDTLFDSGYSYYSTEGVGEDRIIFGAGIQASDLTYSRQNNNDLLITINDPNNPSATDQITIQNWFADSAYQIEQFVFADGATLNAEQVSGLGNFVYGTEGDDNIDFRGTGDTTIFAGDGNDLVYAGENSAVDGGDGNDTIIGSAGTNRLIGGAGNDTITYQSRSSNTIEGGDGDDRITIQGYYHYGDANYRNIITGGKGNDTIQSGGSADAYLFNRGDGSDTLFDNGYSYYSTEGVGEDRIIFGAGIQASDLTYSRQNNNDLLITINDPNNPSATDQITIQNWFADSAYQIEQFVFADGATLNAEQVSGLGNFVYGTEGDDNIDFRGTGDTTIFAGDGNDLVYAGENSAVDGGDGNDTIIGSTGTNRLIGGAGNDTITYQSRSSNTIEGGDGDDRITIQGYYHYGDANYRNIITGGKGNDTIQSGGSADAYLFNRGDGSDTLFDNGYSYYSTEGVGEDRIIFGAGIQASDLTYSRQNNNDLLITINDPNNPSATDQITIQNWFADSAYQIEQFVFADGSLLDVAEIERRALPDYRPEPLVRAFGASRLLAGSGADSAKAAENQTDPADTLPMSEAVAAAHALFSGEATSLFGLDLSAIALIPTGADRYETESETTENQAETPAAEQWLSAATLLQAMPPAAVDAWTRTHTLLDRHLAASDTAALGSDVAGQSGADSSFATLALSSPTSGMGDSGFGDALQTLRPQTALQEGMKLG